MNKKFSSVYLSIPPILALVGYGGMVCVNSKGSLSRINQSFGNIHK